MLFNIQRIVRNQSIINATLFKVILSIFTFLIIFTLFYGESFWEKQSLKYRNDLLINTLRVQTNIQSQISIIEELKKDKNLSEADRISRIDDTIRPIIKNINPYHIGYYDKDLDLLIKNQYSKDISFDEIRSELSSQKGFRNITGSDNLTRIILPIYDQGIIVGYLWAYAQDADLVLTSFNELSIIIILALSLSTLIIISVRKHMTQIKSYLDKFSNIIIYNESEKEDILTKLPELKPVLNKITSFTNDLKRINLDLEASKLNIMRIMEGISDGFYALDRNMQFTFVNKETQKFIGRNNPELLGESIWEVFPQLEGSLTYRKINEAMSQNESEHWEAEGLANPDQNHEFHAYPYREGLTVFFRDITESKRQQQELERLERLNLIAQLAAGISHEIRNPLTTVKGFLQFFGAKPEYVQDKEYIELMISEINRANIIITDFLSMAKANSENIIAQDINEVINKVLPMIQADAFSNNKEVTVDLNQLPKIRINENEIKQLILNLVRNGLEATAEQGCVKISTYLKEEKVVLEIKDQGKGIPQEVQGKMGTPFFTTKESGTGLGLAISMGIAQRHGAGFDFKTGSSGTIFYITFPS